MEIIPYSGKLIKKQYWRKITGYNKLSSSNNKRNVKVVRFGANKPRRPWRLRLAPRLRLARLASPMKLWCRFKDAYMKMMLKLANTSGTGSVFGRKRIPGARDAKMGYSRTEFENRLILEIYKSMVPSLELGYNK
ncbi:hypothetical protein CASFOL_015381 [Castilleja foliolosa]|uniref:Ribosomal protein L16 n=1 Tax=Castilleja foliolosa TaxID=1961234 RepID=A0ABD3DE54_9LAMI